MQSALLFAANTDDVVDWSLLGEKLQHAPLELSAKQRVMVLLDLANGRKVTSRRWNQFVGLSIQKGADDVAFSLPANVLPRIVHNLALIAEGTTEEKGNAARAIASEIGGNILIAPDWLPRRGRQDRIIARNMESAIVYGLWLLTDKHSELVGALCRCKYSACRKFFLKRPGKGGRGAPGRSYCSTKHGSLADREQARERMRRNRTRGGRK